MEKTYSSIYKSETDFDNLLAEYDFRVFGTRINGPLVLEIGCGRGTTTQMLAERFPSLHVVDASDRCVKLAAQRAPPSVQFYLSNVESFEAPVRYDSIIMAHVLEHLDDPVAALKRARNWFAPLGSVHIVVPNADSLHRRLGVAMGLLPTTDALNERDRALGHQRVYNRERLRRDVAAAGFRILHEDSIFLKILSNAQMEKLDRRLIEALFTVGREAPELCTNLYCHAAPI